MRYFLIIFLTLHPGISSAEVVKPNEKLRLYSFQTLDKFEQYLAAAKTDCLANSGGGSRATKCFSTYSEAWDYELNYYYKLLRNQINSEEKNILKDAQLSWINHREKTIDFNSKVLDRKYSDKRGTMYVAMRAGDASKAIVPLIKNRALLLKKWYESVINNK